MLKMFDVYTLADGWYDCLLFAIKKGDISEINKLCKSNNIDVNAKYQNCGKTPLHIAAEFSNKNVILALIANEANVNAVTDRGFNALHIAAQNGHTDMLQPLVEAGINVNSVTGVGTTPLHEAAANGHQAATIKLLELNADPNLKDSRYNLTAYDLASMKGHVDVRNILCPDYQQLFIQNVNRVMSSSILTYPIHVVPNENRFVKALQLTIKSMTDGDEVFKTLKTHLQSDDFKKVSALLQPMKTSLIELMKRYNEDKLNANKRMAATSLGAVTSRTQSKK